MDRIQSIDYLAIAPPLIVALTAIGVLVLDLFLPAGRKAVVGWTGIAGLVAASLMLFPLAGEPDRPRATFCVPGEGLVLPACSYVVDDLTLVFQALVLAGAVVVLLLSLDTVRDSRLPAGEYSFLLLASVSGAVTLAASRDILTLVVALEVVSLPAFALVALRRFDSRSSEGALKLFLVSVVSTAVMLFGLSLVYGLTGAVHLDRLATALADPGVRGPAATLGVVLAIAGFGFKVAAVPFHFWAPDTYEGSPIPVTAFLSVASKAAGFAGLLQVCFVAFEPLADVWAPILGGVAVLTMTLGNLTALQQRNIVRLFAYSSVAQAGYMLVPFALVQPGNAVVNGVAFSAVMLYLLAYAVMNIGAFACIVAVARQRPGRQIADYAGMGTHSPGLAFGLTLFLLSLAGVLPIVIGFYAKLYILRPVVIDPTFGGLVLASAVVINSLIGLYYYLIVAKTMWMDEATVTDKVRPGLALNTAIAVLAVAVLAVGVYPQAFAGFAEISTLVAAP